MKIWELLTDEHVGRLICNQEGNVRLSIKKDQSEDIIITDFKDQIVPVSKMLLAEEWDFVELNGWERSMANSEYFYIADTGIVKKSNEDLSIKEELRYEVANYFSKEEKAQEMLDMEIINRKLKKIADANNEEIDWTNLSQEKYTIGYNHIEDNFILVQCNDHYRTIGSIYFTNKDVAQRALEFVLQDLKKSYR